MSADEDEQGEYTPDYTSQPIVTNAERMQLNRHFSGGDDSPLTRRGLGMLGERDEPTVWNAVNYPDSSDFTFETFWLRYRRQSEAKAIIDKPPNDTWQEEPRIIDEASSSESDDKTEFERAAERFMGGEHTRRQPLHRLNVADRLARLGEYSIIVLGFADGRGLNTPIKGVHRDDEDEEDDSGEFDGPDDLMFVSTFGQDRVVDIDMDTDMTSARFRLPEMYTVVTADDVDEDDLKSLTRHGVEDFGGDVDDEHIERIHWTRVVHVAEGTLEDDLRGEPALKVVFHELLNIDKIKAASAEGFWRGGYTGFQISPPKDDMGRLMEWEDEGEGVDEEFEDFIDNFSRTLQTPAEIQELSTSVGDPSPHLESNYQAISMALDWPQAIMTGEDRADTASSEDVRQWHQKIGQRRHNFAEPVMLRPVIQRLIDSGVFPEPEGDGFDVEWPPLDELSEKQKREIDNLLSKTVKNLSQPSVASFASVAELRHKIGWSPEVGTEVPEDFEPEEEEEGEFEDLNVDEEKLASLIRQMEAPLPQELQDQEPPGAQQQQPQQPPQPTEPPEEEEGEAD